MFLYKQYFRQYFDIIEYKLYEPKPPWEKATENVFNAFL